ncbi:MAG: tRNA pseudouridine(13) synthase TruD [Candidatus Thalassarchaeaceae archaeon]|nr:tRNA pseudouridine(13) synthase TruD [Candidatus Thalassarchaeaceae archaeon]
MDNQSIEEYLGFGSGAVDGLGIGGLLKVRVEDFRVEEVSSIPALDPKGRFTVVRVTLVNWETNRFLKRLSRACGINRNRVFASGLKDKRAITTQLLVIDAPQKKIEQVDIADSSIEILGRTHQKIGMSDHDGNRFALTVRGCCDVDGTPLEGKEAMRRVLDLIEKMSEKLGENIFPNWIGPQRFGSTRPVTPEVGRAVVSGDFEEAVNLYLGMKGLNDGKETDELREMWRETHDPAKCLEIIPRHLGYEKSILESLDKQPDNWVKAYKTLPPSLQLLTVHSLQSLAFNHALAGRLNSNVSLVEPQIGDLVAPVQASGRIDVGKMAEVSDTNLERCRRNCQLGRLAVTGILPGNDVTIASGIPGVIEMKALETTNLGSINWRVQAIPRLTTSGTRRPLSVKFREFSVEEVPEISELSVSKRWDEGPRDGDRWNYEGASLRLKFILPPGTYATVLMRELMRSPLDHY